LNFRGMMQTPKVQNAKGHALFAQSYALQKNTDVLAPLIDDLLDMRCDPIQWGGGAWGYPFPWQARAFFVPKGTPNLICTAYAVKALHRSQNLLKQDHSDVIQGAATFIEKHLLCFSLNKKSVYISYIPDDTTMVHNVNLWGAYVLMLAHHLGGPARFKELAERTVDYTLNAQRPDGSWFYGEAGHHGFVDSFHTGFNLEALNLLKALQPSLQIQQSLEKGMSYYAKAFFGEDGRPAYYDHKVYPIDCHNTAQAVITLLSVNPTPDHIDLAEKVLRWTCQQMWNERRSAFHYQKKRLYTNKLTYMRWTQAWMHLALSQWLSYPHKQV